MCPIRNLATALRSLVKDERGVTAMEYGVIAAATVIAISAGAAAIGPKLTALFASLVTAV